MAQGEAGPEFVGPVEGPRVLGDERGDPIARRDRQSPEEPTLPDDLRDLDPVAARRPGSDPSLSGADNPFGTRPTETTNAGVPTLDDLFEGGGSPRFAQNADAASASVATLPDDAVDWLMRGELTIVVERGAAGNRRLDRSLALMYDPSLTADWAVTGRPGDASLEARGFDMADPEPGAPIERPAPPEDSPSPEPAYTLSLILPANASSSPDQLEPDDEAAVRAALAGMLGELSELTNARVRVERRADAAPPPGEALTITDLVWWRSPPNAWTTRSIARLPLVIEPKDE